MPAGRLACLLGVPAQGRTFADELTQAAASFRSDLFADIDPDIRDGVASILDREAVGAGWHGGQVPSDALRTARAITAAAKARWRE
jgi:hypothetical protein